MNDSSLAEENLDLSSLDLGSGTCPAAGYVGVDLLNQEPDEHGRGRVLCADLFGGEPWPFESDSCTRLRAFHVIEHIPRDRVVIGKTRVRRAIRRPGQKPLIEWSSIPMTQDALFWFFDEAWRIARRGCRFELAWPHPQSDDADKDPTHHRRIPSSMVHYLSAEGRRDMRVMHYPVVCDWTVVDKTLLEIGTDTALLPFQRADGSFDGAAARRSHGAFHEIRVTLLKA